MQLMDPLAAAFRLEGTNGEAVVLTHGFTGVPAHFRPLAAVLHRAGYTVIAPRLAGHGTKPQDLLETDPDDWIASARTAAAEVSDHHSVHLAGLSMGGLISLILARSTGAATVTTIDSPVILRNKMSYLARPLSWFRPTIGWPEGDPPDLDDEVKPFWITYPGFPTKAGADLITIIRRAVIAARHVEVPSLVIQSRTDETVDPRSARVLARLLGSGCRLVWLEHSMHNALLDRERDTIARAVLARLGDASSREGR